MFTGQCACARRNPLLSSAPINGHCDVYAALPPPHSAPIASRDLGDAFLWAIGVETVSDTTMHTTCILYLSSELSCQPRARQERGDIITGNTQGVLHVWTN